MRSTHNTILLAIRKNSGKSTVVMIAQHCECCPLNFLPKMTKLENSLGTFSKNF